MNLFKFTKPSDKETVNCADCGKLTPAIYVVGEEGSFVCIDCYQKHKRYWFLGLVSFLISIPVIIVLIVLLFIFKLI